MDTHEKRPIHPADQIINIITRIYHRGMTTTSGGNVSVLDEQGDLWITPAMVDKGNLQFADIVCIKHDGTINGRHKPSSEYPFHKAVYAVRPEIKVIIHAHPPALVSFSIIRKRPDTRAYFKAWETCGHVGYSGYELTGSQKLGEKIAAEFDKGYNAIVMENHGAVVGAPDADTCYLRFETLEYCARTLLYAHQLGKPEYADDEMIRKYDKKSCQLLPEKDISRDGDILEKSNEISRIIARSCTQGLMAGSFGTISVRLSEDDFLITPRNILRWNLVSSDMVIVQKGYREKGKFPDSAALLHKAIYKQHPRVNSIIQTCPPNIMAFGITHSHINVRTIPEAWIYLQDIPSVAVNAIFGDESEIAGLFAENKPVLLIQNDSLLVTGDTLLQAFDRLEVAEFSAMSLLMAKPAGEFKPITGEQVEELRRTFFKDRAE